jgi:uncharacterized protein YeaO (DUF488 family)
MIKRKTIEERRTLHVAEQLEHRGVKKVDAAIDEWIKDIAPSTAGNTCVFAS